MCVCHRRQGSGSKRRGLACAITATIVQTAAGTRFASTIIVTLGSWDGNGLSWRRTEEIVRGGHERRVDIGLGEVGMFLDSLRGVSERDVDFFVADCPIVLVFIREGTAACAAGAEGRRLRFHFLFWI